MEKSRFLMVPLFSLSFFFLYYWFDISLASRMTPKPFGLEIGLTPCDEAMERISGIPDRESGKFNSSNPTSLRKDADYVSITCLHNALASLEMKVKDSGSPPSTFSELESVMTMKWKRIERVKNEGSCGAVRFKAGRLVMHMEPIVGCEIYITRWELYGVWRKGQRQIARNN